MERPTIEEKYGKWTMMFGWNGKEVEQVSGTPMYRGWYALRIMINKHTLACKAIPAYWHGNEWRVSEKEDSKEITNMFAFSLGVQQNRKEAQDFCDNFDPDLFLES